MLHHLRRWAPLAGLTVLPALLAAWAPGRLVHAAERPAAVAQTPAGEPPARTGTDGSTPFAAASPVFATVIDAVKPWPRLIVEDPRMERSVNEVTESVAGRCTWVVALGPAPAVSGAPLLASAPEAPALKASEPVPEPFSV